MRFLRCGWLLGIALFVSLIMPFGSVARAQSPATPAAIEDALAGRLGGSLASIIDRFGVPDFTEDGLIRYNSVELNGLPTILVVYSDASETVTRLALVYTVQPAALSETIGIMATAADVAPVDGVCDATAISSDFGNRVYPCQSRALATVFDASRRAELGVSQGTPGTYSIAVDPLPDDYFELVIQPGTNGTSLAPTPIPTEAEPTAGTAEPSPTADLTGQYPALTTPAALTNGTIALNDALSFSGTIMTLQVAGTGKQFRLGEDESLGVSALFQVELASDKPHSGTIIFVGYNGDASALAVGKDVTVYGTLYGTQCFANASDVQVCQPLVAADVVNI